MAVTCACKGEAEKIDLRNGAQSAAWDKQTSALPYSGMYAPNFHAFNKDSGMYLESRFRSTHSRNCLELTYSFGLSLSLRAVCSNSVKVGIAAPAGWGLPQFGFPRRFAIGLHSSFRYRPTNKTSPVKGFKERNGTLPNPDSDAGQAVFELETLTSELEKLNLGELLNHEG